MNVGIVGAGGVSLFHYQGYTAAGATIVAIADANPLALAARCGHLAAYELLESLGATAELDEVDAAVLAVARGESVVLPRARPPALGNPDTDDYGWILGQFALLDRWIFRCRGIRPRAGGSRSVVSDRNGRTTEPVPDRPVGAMAGPRGRRRPGPALR